MPALAFMQAEQAVTGILSISVTPGPAHVLLGLAGECDIRTTPQLLDALAIAVAGDKRLVVIDLSALSYLDVAGTHALLAARTALAGQGRSLTLASPQRIVSRMLELTRAAHLIPVYTDLGEALTAG